MTFLVFLNIFFTISMYQLKKNFYGYIHLKEEETVSLNIPRNANIIVIMQKRQEMLVLSSQALPKFTPDESMSE